VIRCHSDNYSLLIRDNGHAQDWSLSRCVGVADVYIPFLWGHAHSLTHTAHSQGLQLETFSEFASITTNIDPVCAWAKTVDSAARGGGCAALVGLALGYGCALAIWPLVLGGGILGALAMGASQHDALAPSQVVTAALERMAEIAEEAQSAPPHVLVALRQQLHEVAENSLSGGVAILVLAQQLDHLLADGM
jgi:hypothetical protein